MNRYFDTKLKFRNLTTKQTHFYKMGCHDFGVGIINQVSNTMSAVSNIESYISKYKQKKVSDVEMLRDIERTLISIKTDMKLICNKHYGNNENFYNQ